MKKSLLFSLFVLMANQSALASLGEKLQDFFSQNKAALIGSAVFFGGLKLARNFTDTRKYDDKGKFTDGEESIIDLTFKTKFNSENAYISNNKVMFGLGLTTAYLFAAKAQGQWNPLKLFFKI